MDKLENSVVISGISGTFPKSENVEELKYNLFNGINMTEDIPEQWQTALPDIPIKMGKVINKSKFDAGFFGVSHKETENMDPMIRMLLEKTHEAILDSGTNPSEVHGSKTAVFICMIQSDSEMYFTNELKNNKNGLKNSMKCMLAKRIAYHFKFIGPCFTLDSACSSSIYCINHAITLIQNGTIDNAIIGGTNFILNPLVTLQFTGLGALSSDGNCKPFDENANGYVRGEVLIVIFLQREKNARRIYTKIIHVKTNCDGFKDQSITYPSQEGQTELLTDFYYECNIDPNDISYIEAHGTGTKAGDPVELNSLDSVLCKQRKSPLLIGSMKANAGHAEPVSGLNSIIKVILAMENGLIPATINHKITRKVISGLVDGRMKVVLKNTNWPNDIRMAGVNSFGFGGANGHILLKANTKQKNFTNTLNLPIMICVSSRIREGAKLMLEKFKEHANDLEYASLLHSIFRHPTPKNNYRGYVILDKGEVINESVTYLEHKKPLCLVFGRPNKNWCNSNNDLSNLPLFNEIVRLAQTVCDNLSLPVDLADLLNNPEDSNNYHIMRGVLIQIGLYHMLIHLNIEIEFDCIQGCSFGQITVAYIKREWSLEETMLTAFYASAIIDDNYDILKNNNNVSLIEILPVPIKNKLNKWLNSMQSYLLVESLPEDTVVLQIGEEIILDTNLHMSFCKSATIISLFESLGRLYEFGYDIDMLKIFPNVSFPVSRGTPMISPQIKWKHDKEWFVMRYEPESNCEYYHRIVTINLREKEWEYLSGHIIDGRILLPAIGYLLIAWDTLSIMKGKPKSNMKYLTIKNIKFIRTVQLDEDKTTQLTVLLQRSNGHYTIKEDGNIVASGEIYETEENNLLTDIPPFVLKESEYMPLNKKDVYKEFIIRNYNYDETFKGISSCNNEVTTALVEWKRNFVTFLDSMLQLPLIEVDTRKLRIPVSIDRINIDVENQFKLDNDLVSVEYHPQAGILRSKFVEFIGSQAISINKRKQILQPVLKSYKFVPNDVELNKKNLLNVVIQLVIENTTGLKIKIIEIIDDAKEPIFNDMIDILKNQPLVQSEIKLLTNKPIEFNNDLIKIHSLIGETDCQLMFVNNLSKKDQLLDQMVNNTLSPGGFILTTEKLNSSCIYPNLLTISVYKSENSNFILLRKHQQQKQLFYLNISSSFENFEWLIKLKENINKEQKIVLLSQGDSLNGILGLVNCLKRELGTENLQCVFICDEDKKTSNFFKVQLHQGLLMNVWKNNQWGTYRYLPIDEHQEIECSYRYISVTKPGDISSAKWLQGPEISKIEKTFIVEVHYAAINNKDIMVSTGLLPTDLIKGNKEHSYNPGFEFSGIDTNNNRVMGLVNHSALSNLVIANPHTTWKIPSHWTLEDAATIPLVYSTVLYALMMVAKIKKGQTILIHSGTGGIGQAAINISLYCGLKVFTTVGSDKKRDYLKKQYPQIDDNHIGYSRNSTFEQLILCRTKGVGVDVVLNSQGEENFHASVGCLAKEGHFIEIGRKNMDKNNKLSAEVFNRGGTFHGIDIEKCLENEKKKKLVGDLLKEAVDKGIVKPLERKIFAENEIFNAFMFMSTGQHVGKILIKMEEQNSDKLKCQRRYSCNPDGAYIIIGGLGGFGMELSNWLVNRGCRKLVLTSRVGVANGYQDMRIRSWIMNGVNVKILTNDVTSYSGCRKILDYANEMGPIISIFNLAVVLKDALIENQTVDNFKISFAPKALATMRLDALSRVLCPKLKDFVIFSSIVSGFGNTGQSNYGMANSVMERICEQRKKDNLPALVIQWGAIGNVGILMEKEDIPKIVGGTAMQSITSCLKVLDRVLRRNEVIISSMIVAEKTDKRDEQLTVKEAVANILGIRNTKTVSMTLTLPQLGLDSVMVVEVKEKLERTFGVYLTLQEIRKLTFEELEKFQDLK